jgi:CzcA family heavy metal efflux pump
MLNAIIRLALRYRLLVVVLSLALLVYGGYEATTLSIDVFPDLDRPRVTVLTECGSMAPEDVENQVTFPLESAFLGATGVQTVRSQSGPGLSVVFVEFAWGTDIRMARQVVQEKLATLRDELPEGIKPQMAPISSILGRVMIAGLHRRPGPQGGMLAPVGDTGLWAERLPGAGNQAEKLLVWQPTDINHPSAWEAVKIEETTWSPASANPKGDRAARVIIHGKAHDIVFRNTLSQQLELRTLADWVIRPRLLKVPGVSQVLNVGAGRKQYQVLVNPTALQDFGVSLQEVDEALKKNNVNATGGFAIEGERERPIRILGRLGPAGEQVVKQLKLIPVKNNPQRTVLLEQVAQVEEGEKLKRGDASINGYPGVEIIITKQPHTDTRALTDQLTAELRGIEASLPADIVLNSELFQMKGFIDRAILNVAEALAIGAFLVLIILFLFLLNFRTTFISLSAIPLSLVITTLVFKLVSKLSNTELSINIMTLGGIAVAMGELVDDAIVDVENIFRRLRENNALPEPRPALRVVYEASLEVRSAIVFGTIMVILVFLPLFALSGVEGRLFAPLGVAYITAILASLLVSLTVTPVLSYYLLPQAQATHHKGDGWLVHGLKWIAGYLIRFSMAYATPLFVLTWVFVGLSGWMLTRLGTDFLPPFDEGSVQVNLTLPPGSSLEASNRIAEIADAKFQSMRVSHENPQGEILQFVRRSGRGELDEEVDPVNATEYILTINSKAGRSREEIIKQLLHDLKEELPGVDLEAEQPLAHLISHMLSGVTAQIAIKLYGDDLETLANSAQQIQRAIKDVPGLTPPVVEAQRLSDELHIRPRPDDLAYYGVSRAFLADYVQTALQGEVVSQVQEGQRRFDLLVRLQEPTRSDYGALGNLRVDLPENRGQVALKELADIGPGVGANQVNRDNGKRRLVVRANALGRDLGSVVADIKERIQSQVKLPQGYYLEFGGQFESQQRATRLIAILAVLSFLGMFVVLLVLFPSARIVLQILNALPTAFIGGVLALVITRQTLSVASLVGFISLGGIAARNGILLVTHYFHLMRKEDESFSQAMILRGSLERLAPVLMTALTAGIGLIPLVIGGQQPGREILYPVATVILGGLVTSTFCEFLIHPGLFWKFSGKDAERLVNEGKETNVLEDHYGNS